MSNFLWHIPDWLEWDYYRVFGSITTPNGQTIDIGNPNDVTGAAYFEFAGNYRWLVQSTIHANGNDGVAEPRTIYFRPAEGVARWMRLEINIPDDVCWLNGCDMASGGYAVYAYGGTELNVPALDINNCRFADSEYQNVLVSGDISVHFTDCEFTGAQWDGLTISNNENRSTVRTSTFSGNGSAGTYYAALRFNSSFPLGDAIASNTIGLNPNRGVYFFSSAPDFGGQGVGANVIYNNGPDQGQGGLIGAELYLTTGSEPTITQTNIWDADGQGTLWQDDYITGVDWPPQLDEDDDFEAGVALQRAGRSREAVDRFLNYLHRDGSKLQINALHRLFWSWRITQLPPIR